MSLFLQEREREMQGIFASPPPRVQATPARVLQAQPVVRVLQTPPAVQAMPAVQVPQAVRVPKRFSPELEQALLAHFESKKREVLGTRVFFATMRTDALDAKKELLKTLTAKVAGLKAEIAFWEANSGTAAVSDESLLLKWIELLCQADEETRILSPSKEVRTRQLQAQIAGLEKQVESKDGYTEKEGDRNAQITRMREDLQELLEKAVNSGSRMEATPIETSEEETATELQTEIEQLKVKLTAVTEDKNQIMAEKHKLEAQIVKVCLDQSQVQKENNNQKTKIQELNLEIKELQTQNQTYIRKEGELEAEKQKLEQERDGLKGEKEALEDALKAPDVFPDHVELREENATLKAKVAKTETELKTALEQLEALNQKLTQREAEHQESLDKLICQLSVFKTPGSEEEKAQLIENIKNLKSEQITLQEENKHIRLEFQAEKEKFEHENETLAAKIESLTENCNKLEEKNTKLTVTDVVTCTTNYVLHMTNLDVAIQNQIKNDVKYQYKIENDDIPDNYMRMATLACCNIIADVVYVLSENCDQATIMNSRAREDFREAGVSVWEKIMDAIEKDIVRWMNDNKNVFFEKCKDKESQKEMILLIMKQTEEHLKSRDFYKGVLEQVTRDADHASAKERDEEEKKSGKKEARELDKEYARLVAGAIQAQSISQVWGPRDGVLLNSAETRQMQEDLFSELTAIEEEGSGRKRGGSSVRSLAEDARRKRMQFNEGWNNPLEVGIMPVVVHSETRILDILMAGRHVPAVIAQSIAAATNEPNGLVMNYIRVLRRHELTRPYFAAAVGLNMVSISMTKPTARPTKVQAYQACTSARSLINALISRLNEGAVVQALVRDVKVPLKHLTVDYHKQGTDAS